MGQRLKLRAGVFITRDFGKVIGVVNASNESDAFFCRFKREACLHRLIPKDGLTERENL